MITDKELEEIEARVNSAQPGPWKAIIEGRDQESGSSFILTGGDGDNRGEDIYLDGATDDDYDFIANARQDIPRLLQEFRELKKKII